jgi:multidrug efflux system membrane fusion protein
MLSKIQAPEFYPPPNHLATLSGIAASADDALQGTNRMNVARGSITKAVSWGLPIALAISLTACGKPPAPQSGATAAVDVAVVIDRSITEWQDYSGRLQAIDHVDIRAQVPGTIMAVYFKDGQMVRKGDPLFLIDPRVYSAAVDRAAAQLASAHAKQKFTSDDYTRAQKLLSGNAIARRDYDDRANAALEAAAEVKAAEAALEEAKVNLGYTRITAPVSGRMSRAEQTVGNIVAAGLNSPPLTTLVSMDPIYAGFDMDEQTYLKYLSHASGHDVPARLGLADEAGFSRTGKIASVDNQLNGSSGTIRVRATFANADGSLLPGMFARVAVGGGAAHPAILIDDRAISTDQAKKFVFVLDEKSAAQYREVFPGSMVDGFRVIDAGLKPGEKIVVNGLQRIHPGDAVKASVVPMTGEASPATRP